MENTFDFMSLAIRGRNIDRIAWTIGRGGVGQSLLTAHLHALFEGVCAYIDTNVYYTDEEMRKQAKNEVLLFVAMVCP